MQLKKKKHQHSTDMTGFLLLIEDKLSSGAPWVVNAMTEKRAIVNFRKRQGRYPSMGRTFIIDLKTMEVKELT